MGALNGSMSYLRFLIEGGLGDNINQVEKSVQSRRFVPLSPTQESPAIPGESAGVESGDRGLRHQPQRNAYQDRREPELNLVSRETV